MNCAYRLNLGLFFLLFFSLGITTATAEPPTQEDVNVYATLCKTGSLSAFDFNAEA